MRGSATLGANHLWIIRLVADWQLKARFGQIAIGQNWPE
jgi:hypothetical protein